MNDTGFSRKAFVVINYLILTLAVLSVVIPFVNIVSSSVSSEVEIIKSNYLLFPKGITLDAYRMVFKTSTLYQSIINSIKVVVIGVPFSVLVTVVAAYLLTCEKLYGRRILGHLLSFSLLFYPGVVPLYILYKNFHMLNNHSVLIVPFLMISYYLVYVKNFFYTIPVSLHESARIDGAGELTILFRIVLPLVKPIIAVLILWYIVNYWTLYFYPLAFITDISKRTIQPILRDIVMNTNGQTQGSAEGGASGALFGVNVAMAVMVISVTPILISYPYLQKYLIQGIMVGSVKG